MTVREAAGMYNLTRQSVYARLRGRVKEITDSKGEMTAEALEVLKDLYGEPVSTTDNDSQRQQKTVKLTNELTEQVNALTDQVDALTGRAETAENKVNALNQACEVLQVKLDAAQSQVQALTQERDFLRSMLDKSMTLALPAAAQDEKLTLWERLTGRRKTKPEKKPDADQAAPQ